jgi:uncharacterized membrane protein
MPKEAIESTHSIQLPEAEERELQEELRATTRSASSIVTEALRLRRMVLEALGIEAAGTDPAEVASAAKRALKAGVRALRAAQKRAKR